MGRKDKTYVIPEGVVKIEAGLQNAAALETLVLPSTMTALPGAELLSGLISVEAAMDNPAFSSVDGVLFLRDGETLVRYPEKKPGDTYAVPHGVKEIGAYAFPANAVYLQHATLPDGLTHIGTMAFEGCTGLESVWLPDSVTHIARSAFEDCESLSRVRFPQSLVAIEAWAFASTALSGELRIPDGVVYIGDGAFAGLHFTDVYLPQGIKYCEVGSTFGWWDMQPQEYTMVIHVKVGTLSEWFANRSLFPVEAWR